MIKLINERTKEIVVFGDGIVDLAKIGCKNVAEMIEAGWKDYKEPETYYYFVDIHGQVKQIEDLSFVLQDKMAEIGNRFGTEEETEKAVEKLKAITRLSKCGFRFEGYDNRDRTNGGDIVIYAHVDTPHNNLIEDAQPSMLKDLDLLFGGGE